MKKPKVTYNNKEILLNQIIIFKKKFLQHMEVIINLNYGKESKKKSKADFMVKHMKTIIKMIIMTQSLFIGIVFMRIAIKILKLMICVI